MLQKEEDRSEAATGGCSFEQGRREGCWERCKGLTMQSSRRIESSASAARSPDVKKRLQMEKEAKSEDLVAKPESKRADFPPEQSTQEDEMTRPEKGKKPTVLEDKTQNQSTKENKKEEEVCWARKGWDAQKDDSKSEGDTLKDVDNKMPETDMRDSSNKSKSKKFKKSSRTPKK